MWQPDAVGRVRRAGGSRTVLDVLRHPAETFKSDSDREADLAAVREGELRSVTCFLRGSASGLPDSFKYGTLTVGPEGMTWQAYWRHRGKVLTLPPLTSVIAVSRPSGPGAWNIKRNLFKMVETAGPEGGVQFAVPGVGAELIRQAIQTTRIPPPLLASSPGRGATERHFRARALSGRNPEPGCRVGRSTHFCNRPAVS
jgi:hypothetical protein